MVVLSVVEAFEGRRFEEDPFWDEDTLAGASSAWVDPLGAFFLFLGAGGAATAPFAPLTEGDMGPFVGLEVGIVIELLGIMMPVPGPPPPATNDPGEANPADAGPPGP